MAKIKDLYAKTLVTSFLRGKDHPKTKALGIIWDFANAIAPTGDKRPEDSMLVHTTMVALRNRGFTVTSDPNNPDHIVNERKKAGIGHAGF